jgi:hypothetical protein
MGWLSWTRKMWDFIALLASQRLASEWRASSEHMSRGQIEAEQTDSLKLLKSTKALLDHPAFVLVCLSALPTT